MERKRWKFLAAAAAVVMAVVLFVPLPVSVICPSLTGLNRISIRRSEESVELRDEECALLIEKLENEKLRWRGFAGRTYTINRYSYDFYGDRCTENGIEESGSFTVSDQGYLFTDSFCFQCDESLIDALEEAFASAS